jgi:hypothetical protein
VGGADVEGVVEVEAFIVVEVDSSRAGAFLNRSAMTAALRLLTLARNHSLPCRRLILSHYIAPSSSHSSFFRRSFVSTQPHRAAPAPTPPATPAVLRRSPTLEDIQTAELDIETLAQGDAQLVLTERAAQVCRNFGSRYEQFDIWCMCSNSIEYLRKKRTQVPP